MKTILNQLLNGRITRLGFLPALVIAALSASAGNNYTGNGYVTKIPVPPVLCTAGSGQTLVRASVQTVCVQTDDPRTTGRRQMFLNAACQADGSHLIWGTGYQEVGTWNAAGEFTPTAGLWELSYRTVMPADHCLNCKLVGVGYGGVIDGQRLEENVTRPAAADIIDPREFYLYAGTINPAPLISTAVIGNFDALYPPSWERGAGAGKIGIGQANGQMTIRGYWPGIRTGTPEDTTAYVVPARPWAVKPGQSLEARVDLVSLKGDAPGAVLAVNAGSDAGYWMMKSRDLVCLGKQNGGIIFFTADKRTTPNANEVLVLALTPDGKNVILTARVLDKSNGNILYERSVVDTPAADPSMHYQQVTELFGRTTMYVGADRSGAPWTSGSTPWLGVFQYTDGTLPAAEATFDNFELRTYAYEVPKVGIEPALRLSWQAPASVGWTVEGAPSTQGPWLPVQDSLATGVQQVTVPADEGMKFFRLRQAP
jgi:hypothetical protein